MGRIYLNWVLTEGQKVAPDLNHLLLFCTRTTAGVDYLLLCGRISLPILVLIAISLNISNALENIVEVRVDVAIGIGAIAIDSLREQLADP
jgi:hypothetical protein